MVVLLLCVASPLRGIEPAAAASDVFSYQVAFPAPPRDGGDAVATLDARKASVATAVACGGDVEFWLRTRIKDSNEDIIGQVLGKLLWIMLQPHAPDETIVCKATTVLNKDRLFSLNDMDNNIIRMTEVDWDDLQNHAGAGLNTAAAAAFGGPCGGIISSVAPSGADVSVTFTVPRQCLVAEINLALKQMQKGDQLLGSSDLPCYLFTAGKTVGEWDVSVRDLTRIVYLDRRLRSRVLDPGVVTHITSDLLVADGPPGLASYSPLQCGNQENSTGSPEERADESDWASEALDTVGDWLNWLARRLALFVAAAALVAAAVAAAALGPVAAAIAAAVIAALGAGTAILTVARIPETENHRLMIESSRFLNNQLILDALRNSGYDTGGLESDQADVRHWLLDKLQAVLKGDFEEFNARPYQRYSLLAILNLADFASDDALQTAARAVLNCNAAKFAVGSSQGRRLVPFRRRMEIVKREIEAEHSMFDQGGGDDYSIALMLYYAGQIQQSPNGHVSRGAASNMIYPASSSFVPDPLVLDLAIQQGGLFQRGHHAGYEVYSRGAGFLLTGGGVETGPANRLEIGPFGTFFDSNDRGAAVPTTLMLAGASDRTTRAEYLRIEGQKVVHDDKVETFEGNLCVWHGFACGLNIKVPADMNNATCLQPGPAGSPDQWRFLDTASCDPYKPGPHVFVAVYREACRSSSTGCEENFGFIEAVDAGNDDFETFKRRTLEANPPGFIVPPDVGGGLVSFMAGTFRSADGEEIKFDCDAFQKDSDKSGIAAVDGTTQGDISDWSLASGDVLEARGGRVTIRNNRLAKTMRIDMTDRDAPTISVN